jgi:putative lipoprotein
MLRRAFCLPVAIALLLSGGCSSDGASAMGRSTPAPLVDTTWLAEDIGGSGVVNPAQTSMSFHSAGRVAGSGGCNRYSGAVNSGWTTGLSFSDLGSTLKACEPTLMDQERRFFEVLAATRSYKLPEPGNKLLLFAADGRPLAQFSAHTP